MTPDSHAVLLGTLATLGVIGLFSLVLWEPRRDWAVAGDWWREMVGGANRG